MSHYRKVAALAALSLLAVALAPAAAAVVASPTDALAPALDAAHDNIPDEGPTDGAHDVIDELSSDEPDLEHAVAEHLVPETVAWAGSQEVPDHGVRSVTITSPDNEGAVSPGDPVQIAWSVPVIDPLAMFYVVQVKDSEEGAEWQDLGKGYRCTNEPGTVSGSCALTWTPTIAGLYAIRVVHVTPGSDEICSLKVNCDVVTPFYVDGAPPTAPTLSASPMEADVVKAGVFSVSAASTDDLWVDRIVVTASNLRGEKSCTIPAGQPSCNLDAKGLLENQLGGAYVGELTLTAVAHDKVGNPSEATLLDVDVDSSTYLVVVEPIVVPALVEDGKRISVTYAVRYALPAAMAGEPATGAAFTLELDGVQVCARTVTATGTVACFVEGAAQVSSLRAAAVSPAGHDVLGSVRSITWTSLAIERLAASDLPTPSDHADPGEVYRAAFRVTTTHDGAPAVGVLIELGGESVETTDASGFVRVPVVREATAVESFDVSASGLGLESAAPAITVTWTTIDVGLVSVSDPFVNVGDSITFTASAVYEHDAEQDVEAATLAFADGFEGACTLADASIADGSLSATVTCTEVLAEPILLVVVDSTRGITTLTAPLALDAVWTQIVVSDLANDALVNVGSAVMLTGTARYAHDDSDVPSADVVFAETTEGCLGTGAIVEGSLAIEVTCTAVHAAPIALLVENGDAGVDLLAAPLVHDTIWTRVVVADLQYDDFVNVGDAVLVTATATYEHDGSLVPGATLAFAGAEPCALSAATIDAGALAATILCDDVHTGSLPLVLATAHEDVTLLAQALEVDGIWTEIVITAPTLDDAFVAVGDAVTFTATATYAHDESDVPSADVVADLAADCEADEGAGIAAGLLTIVVRCTSVSPATGTLAGLSLADGHAGVDRLAAELDFAAVWTRVVIVAAVDDDFVNLDDNVLLSGIATWAHDGTNVPAATVVFADPVPGCDLVSGAIADGALSVTATCSAVSAATGTSLPLVLQGTSEGVDQLAAPLSLDATWTRIVVTYVEDAPVDVLAPNAPVVFTATAIFEHDGSAVQGGVVVVRSTAPGDQDEFVCVTDADGSCSVEVAKTLGRFEFVVEALSSSTTGVFTPDIVRNADSVSKHLRWTAITFSDLMCSTGGPAVACDGAQFTKGTFVTVSATAIAADTGETLGSANVRLGGNSMTTDGDGDFSRSFTRLTAGTSTIIARGVSATLDGVEVTWDLPVQATLRFV